MRYAQHFVTPHVHEKWSVLIEFRRDAKIIRSDIHQSDQAPARQQRNMLAMELILQHILGNARLSFN